MDKKIFKRGTYFICYDWISLISRGKSCQFLSITEDFSLPEITDYIKKQVVCDKLTITLISNV